MYLQQALVHIDHMPQQTFDEIKQVVDWNLIDKADYLSVMERSPINDLEIKFLIFHALTDRIDERALYMKGIDVSYYYEGYTEYTIDEV